MASEWPRVAVAEVCELIVDCVNKTATTVEGPTPYKMIRTPNVKAGRVSTDDCRYVDEEAFLKWTRRASVQKDDVLLTREAPLGEVGIVNTEENIFLGQRLMQYRANTEYLDAHFLVYSFLSPDLQHQFHMHEGSGSVVSHIRVGDCSKFELSLPPLYEQKRISGILRALDDKIQLNRQTNQTLEAMAQALFKSWFVDFDPVIDNALAAGHEIPEPLQARAEQRKAFLSGESSDDTLPESIRQLFPNRFVLDAEMGWIPEGWGVDRLDSIAAVIDPHPSHRAPKEVENGFPFSGIGDIDEMGNINIDKARSIGEEAVLEQESAYSITDSSIGFGRVGTVGKVVRLRPQNYRYALSPTMAVMNPLEKYNAELVYCLVKSHNFLHQVESNMTGSTRPALGIQVLRSLKVVLPLKNAEQILQAFSNYSANWISAGDANNRQISILTKLRDTLLPKLISGELRLPESTTADPQAHSETVAA